MEPTNEAQEQSNVSEQPGDAAPTTDTTVTPDHEGAGPGDLSNLPEGETDQEEATDGTSN
jgi:hypothetical protein